jgi:3-oxoacyl-[acyl-carrier-protein] synthase II
MMLAGGTEAAIHQLSFAGYHAARALVTEYDSPETASRPFDARRNGFVHGEGAAILVLESLESATDRGAEILAEIQGIGLSADAHHITAPPDDGGGAALAMRRAFRGARIPMEELDYINAHGTSTPIGDLVETRAIRQVFGERADLTPVSSTKSMLGHALEAGPSASPAIAAEIPPRSVIDNARTTPTLWSPASTRLSMLILSFVVTGAASATSRRMSRAEAGLATMPTIPTSGNGCSFHERVA